MSRLLRLLLAPLLLLSVVAGGCGGDDDDGESSGAATTAAAVGDDAEADDAEGNGDDDSESGETQEDESDGDVQDADGESAGGDAAALMAADDFCEFFELANSSELDIFAGGPSGTTPDELEATFGMAVGILNRAAQLAPDEAKDPFNTLAEAMTVFVELLEEYEWDMVALSTAAQSDPTIQQRLAAMEDPRFQEASDAVDGIVLEECGITLD